jgi:FkbM family methyltransferase
MLRVYIADVELSTSPLLSPRGSSGDLHREVASLTRTRWQSIRARIVRARAVAWPSRFLIRYLVGRRVSHYPNRVVRHTYGGYDFSISLEDPVAQAWYDHDWPLMPELESLRTSRLVAGARVFEIGAHQGVVALMLSRLVEPAGEVVAVEAEQHNFEVAVRNRDRNEAGNLQLTHAAGGANDGWLQFRDRLNGTVVKGGRVGLTRVRALTVDSLAARHGAPDVVFIDVEGYEHEVLRGAQQTLAAGKSDFFVEVHVGYGLEDLGGSVQMVLDHFDPTRFQLLVSPSCSELEHYDLHPISERPDMFTDRFYLVALAGR